MTIISLLISGAIFLYCGNQYNNHKNVENVLLDNREKE